MCENSFWRVCEVLDNSIRLELVRYLLSVEKTEFPCVIEIAEKFHLGGSTTSAYLKKLADVGLIVSKRSERCIYYRAFATTPEANEVVKALRRFFESRPTEDRTRELLQYIHALSHYRRNAIIRCLNTSPGLDLKELAVQTEIPYPTVDRLLEDLGRAHIVDLTGRVIQPAQSPESVFLALTLA